jgi:hypothetical protein
MTTAPGEEKKKIHNVNNLFQIDKESRGANKTTVGTHTHCNSHFHFTLREKE